MNNYIRKIEAERVVLRVVNMRFPEPLHGLSEAAIASWSKRVEAPKELLSDLLDVGDAIGAMCERSGERIQQAHLARMEGGRRAAIRFQARQGR